MNISDHHTLNKGANGFGALAFGTWPVWGSVLTFSVFANLLLLTGPIFMLQVYDRVLSSRSDKTLLALFLLVVLVYAIMGLLDYARRELLNRLGAALQEQLDGKVFSLEMRRSTQSAGQSKEGGTRDVETVRRFTSSATFVAILDLPWTPFFVAAIFMFHPLLGWLSLVGGSVLFLLALGTQWVLSGPVQNSQEASAHSDGIAGQALARNDIIEVLGMGPAILDLWSNRRTEALKWQIAATSRTAALSSFTKAFRLLLQSSLLALGAWLVLRNEVTPGVMIASSIMMGRALAPVEQSIAGWTAIKSARFAWTRLASLLKGNPSEPVTTELPTPDPRLDVSIALLAPPMSQNPCLSQIRFSLESGQAVGVIGPSAAGKSSLARALTGLWKPHKGDIRLGGAALDQYSVADRARHIGYMPQDASLFDATIAENIARLSAADSADVIKAAELAGAHEMVLGLPQGYDTPVGPSGNYLSGGQRQRIALARALFGNPALVVLDEPESGLDGAGTDALNNAIKTLKSAGKAVVVMAHRPSAIAECDQILILQNGQMTAFGPREIVLRAELIGGSTRDTPSLKSTKSTGVKTG